MDIKELDKKQLILLTLLITFIVSIATGIITVSLMNQMPKSVPQTINNVIQRTIEKVTTVQVPAPISKVDKTANTEGKSSFLLSSSGDALVSIYLKDAATITPDINPITPDITITPIVTLDENGNEIVDNNKETAIGQGIIISDIGLILVENSILNESLVYKVVLNKIDFDATILKKFNNGFTILKISEIKAATENAKKIDNTKIIQ